MVFFLNDLRSLPDIPLAAAGAGWSIYLLPNFDVCFGVGVWQPYNGPWAAELLQGGVISWCIGFCDSRPMAVRAGPGGNGLSAQRGGSHFFPPPSSPVFIGGYGAHYLHGLRGRQSASARESAQVRLLCYF